MPETSAAPASAASVTDMRAARLPTIMTSPDPASCGVVFDAIKRAASHLVNELRVDWIQPGRSLGLKDELCRAGHSVAKALSAMALRAASAIGITGLGKMQPVRPGQS